MAYQTNRLCLTLRHRLRRLQEFFDFFLFARFGFKLCPYCKFSHDDFLQPIRCGTPALVALPPTATAVESHVERLNVTSRRFLAEPSVYNADMSLTEQIQKDIVSAMKAKEEARLSTLRMVKSALHLRQVQKMAPLDEQESQAVLATLIKQRKESVEQFTKGGRQEMADKEAAEIVVIESYLPNAASEAEIVTGVKAAIAEMGSPTMKEMGTVMKNAMARFNAAGMRVDGKTVSEIVKKELAGK